MKLHTIWVVDDDVNLVRRIEIAGRSRDWQVIGLAPDQSEKLPTETADLILLDYHLDGRNAVAVKKRNAWYDALDARKLCNKTLIVTNFPSVKIQIWVKEEGFAGVLIKPLDLDKISEMLAAKAPLQNVGILGDVQPFVASKTAPVVFPVQRWFDSLEQAICIVDNQACLITQNVASKSDAIFSSERVGAALRQGRAVTIWYSLVRQVNTGMPASRQAQHWEWSNEKSKWVEWNLQALNTEAEIGENPQPAPAYLLTRALHDTYTPLAAGSLSDKLSLKAYMEHLSQLLNSQWGITRLRLYAIEKVAGEKRKDAAKCLHLLPLAQVGGGMKNKTEKGELEWLQTEFNFQDGITAHKLKKLPPGTAIQSRVDIENQKPRPGDSAVEWGNAGSRAQMMIGKLDDDESLQLVGQLSFDRRSDHLPVEQSSPTLLYGAITDDDLKGMEGILKKVNKDLFQRLRQNRDLRMINWQKRISETLAECVDTVSKTEELVEPPYARAQRLICGAFDALLKNWNSLQHEPVLGHTRHQSPDDIASTDLLELYVAEGISEDLLRCEIGANQPVWKLRSHRRSNWRKVWPFKEVWQGEDYETFVMQDFQEARRIQAHNSLKFDPITRLLDVYKLRGLPEDDVAAARTQYEQVGSWAGIKIPRGKDRHWVLVAMARGKDIWTSSRIEWLDALAKSLTTVLRWWEAEVEREWFSHALTHELRKPMQLLEGEIDKWLLDVNSDDKRPVEDRRKKGVNKANIASASALVKMHAHMIKDIQQITNIRLASSMDNEAQCCTWAEVLQSIAWVFEHHPNKIEKSSDIITDKDFQLLVPESALAHVLTNLLLNAIKFSWGPLQKQVLVTMKMANNHADKILEIDIRNAVKTPILPHRRADMLLPYVRGPSSESGTSEGIGAGLAVVNALCRQHQMYLKIDDQVGEGFVGHWQIFKLSIKLHKKERNHGK